MTISKEQILSLPWVQWHEEEARCTATLARACKNGAHYQFLAHRASTASPGDYCWTHIQSQGIGADDTEKRRADVWLTAHPESVDG